MIILVSRLDRLLSTPDTIAVLILPKNLANHLARDTLWKHARRGLIVRTSRNRACRLRTEILDRWTQRNTIVGHRIRCGPCRHGLAVQRIVNPKRTILAWNRRIRRITHCVHNRAIRGGATILQRDAGGDGEHAQECTDHFELCVPFHLVENPTSILR